MNQGNDVQQLLREAGRLERQQQWPAARLVYRQLLALEPGRADSWYNLARLERRLGNPQGALSCYQRALEVGVSKPEEVHLNRGVIFCDDLRQYIEAEVAVRTALQLNPGYLPALLNLEYLCELLGRRDEAIALCEKILARQPDQAAALARLAELHHFSDPRDPLITRLRAALEKPEMHPAEPAAIGFALGRALDECGDHDAAFSAYARANRYSRLAAADSGPLFDRTACSARVDSIIASQTEAATGASGSTSPPVFIFGLMRSGAGVLERLLAKHPSVQTGGALPHLPWLVQNELEPFPQKLRNLPAGTVADMAGRYQQAVRAGKPVATLVVDRQVGNYDYIGLAKLLFPDSRIIYTTRALLDNCLAIWFQHLDHSAGYALDLRDIAHYIREQQRLLAHWRGLYGNDLHEVSYDRLVAEPQGELTHALRFLGLDWDEACRAGIATVASHHSGRWRNYRNDLGELAAALEIDLATQP